MIQKIKDYLKKPVYKTVNVGQTVLIAIGVILLFPLAKWIKNR